MVVIRRPLPLFRFEVGEVFVHCSMEETTEMLEQTKDGVLKEISEIESKSSEYQKILSDLKVKLYAKFGNNINLESDPEKK